ncbi:TadE/TadG family type IV pilus assembly protein [Nocardiopsis mangrovi]|uniref:TadE/TadG family type IV pilus assembly protein n=1 Tax=Nocardiopsis mangrovi TaxID=1179818 RepID=A0ABV9DPW6_9ACTN
MSPEHDPPRRRRARTPRQRRGDRGSQFVEFAAYFPLFLLLVALAFEVFAYFIAVERMHNAARTAARVVSTQGIDAATRTAQDSLPGWMDDAEVTIAANDNRGYYAVVSIDLPIIFDATGLDFTVSRRVDMPSVGAPNPA